MDGLTRRPSTRRRRLLRSLLSGGWAYLGLFLVVHAVLAFASDGVTAVDAVVLVLVGSAQWLLVRTRALALPTQQAWSVLLLCIVGVVAGLAGMAPYGEGDAYSAWFLGAVTIDLLGLAVVGRFGVAWLAMAATVAAVLSWGAIHDVPTGAAAGLVVRQVATLLVGTVLAIGVRRSSSAFTAFRALQRRRIAEEGAARARIASRRTGVEQVLEQAGPTLRALADGRRISADDRRQLLVLEGALRDRIRTPGLRRGRLTASVDAARHRGVNVLLMDEAAAAPDDLRASAVDWLAERLDAVVSGGFVGRVRAADDGVRASAVDDDRSETRRFARTDAAQP